MPVATLLHQPRVLYGMEVSFIVKPYDMFTAADIITAHSKVRSGADFPAYISELKDMGVTRYDAFVVDGHIVYQGANDYTVTVPAKYPNKAIAANCNKQQFVHDLKEHQAGGTGFLQFVSACAASGVDKWQVQMDRMTCTYYDINGTEVLVENIPVL